jgi:hypothetical protein
VFEGYLNLVAPKGKDGFGAETKTELLAHPKLMVDVLKLAGGIPDKLSAGVGWEYWRNKFGNDENHVPGSRQSAAFFEVSYHL